MKKFFVPVCIIIRQSRNFGSLKWMDLMIKSKCPFLVLTFLSNENVRPQQSLPSIPSRCADQWLIDTDCGRRGSAVPPATGGVRRQQTGRGLAILFPPAGCRQDFSYGSGLPLWRRLLTTDHRHRQVLHRPT